MPLRRIVAQPVLEERGVEWRGAESIEAKAFTGVYDGEFARHGQHGALAGSVCELWGRGADECDYGGGVDDAAFGLLVLAQGEDGVLAAVPDTLDVDVVREIPDVLGCVDGIS